MILTPLINQLITFLLIFYQLNHLIASTTLTLKSSNSHLNLNRILTSDFSSNNELYLSFKYKPLNQHFVLISGILDLQSERTELNELLKFTLIINSNDQAELIIDKANKVSSDNLLINYFQLVQNQTKVIAREKVDSFRSDQVNFKDNLKSNIKNNIKNSSNNKIKKLINDVPISKFLNGHLTDQEQNLINNVNLDNYQKKNNWRLLSVVISKDEFKVIHTIYSQCLLNRSRQSNCKQQHINYRLKGNLSKRSSIKDSKDDLINEKSKIEQTQNYKEEFENSLKDDETKFMELNQLLIGKKWSESDGLLVNLVNRPKDANNDFKQLNETEDLVMNSQIHSNFLQNSNEHFQTSSHQEPYSGLIGCLDSIKFNDHYLEFTENVSLNDELKQLNSSAMKSIKNEIDKNKDEIDKNKNEFDNDKNDNVVKNKRQDQKEIETDYKKDALKIDVQFIKDDLKERVAGNIAENVLNLKDNKTELEDEVSVIDWWKVYKWSSVLVGKIEIGLCNETDPCANFCLHNATCLLDEDGNQMCHCDLFGYTGERCFFPLYKRNCKELELLGFRTNGQYIIDSDGIGDGPPSHVYCRFRSKVDNDTKTLIYHNLNDETVVRSESFNNKPFYFRLKYRDFTQEMLVNYMNQFRTCKQEIRYDCHQARFGFGDYAWFRKLSLSNSLNIVDRILDQNDTHLDQHAPNKACSSNQDVWNFEKIKLYNSSAIVEAYFLPLPTCAKKGEQKIVNCNQQSLWQRLTSNWFNTNSTTSSKSKYQMKARAGKRKRKPEARLTISPLECSGFKQESSEVAFSTEASYIEINYRDLVDKNSKLFAGQNVSEMFFSIKHISFNFRTLQAKPGILLHITLKPKNLLYFEIMLKNEYELECAYPHNGKMKVVKLSSIQRINTGDWQLIQLLFNDKEMRFSVNTISILFNFDGKSMFDKFQQTIYVGSVPRTIGNLKSKIGFIGCFRELNFGYDKTVNLKQLIHPKLIKQILPTCKKICVKNPCENGAVCIEHWSFRRCVCRNKFAHIGFSCELNLNKNSITIMTGKPFIHLVLNRNFNKFLQNELNEFINQNTIRTLIDLNAEQLAKLGKLNSDSDLSQVNVKGVKNLHKSEEKRWNELLLMNNSSLLNSSQNVSISNQTFNRLIEQPSAGLGLDRWDAIDKGKLKMTLQFEFRTRVDAGLLFYANDNLNNFIQLHFVDKKRLCLTFNILDKIVRIEIILDDGVLNSGEPIQLRVKRYLEYTVFHVLIYYKKLRKYEQKTIYLKLPCRFLSIYSHKPFKMNTDFDYFYKLEPELTYKFVNFDEDNENNGIKTEEEEDEVNVETLNANNSNKTDKGEKDSTEKDGSEKDSSEKDSSESTDETEYLATGNTNLTLQNSVLKSLIAENSKAANSSSALLNNSALFDVSSTSKLSNNSGGVMNQNKFSEQVLPIRGYYKLQVFPSLFIEMTDNAETYDGLFSNLEKIIDDENEFLKPLNLIYLANLNNFDSYFGLNKTFNTSTSSLTKNIQSITTNVLQSNKTTNYVPLLSLLNNTISKINLTSSLNSSLQNSLKLGLKNSLEISLQNNLNNTQKSDNNSTLNKIQNNTQNSSLILQKSQFSAVSQQNGISNASSVTNQAKNQANQTSNLSIDKNSEEKNMTYTLNSKNYTQIYIGNVDGNNTLSSLPAFVGCISGVIFNNQLINLTKITEKRHQDELKSGKILNGCKMLCTIKGCQNSGKCIDNWMINNTICNCTNTSYTGDTCTDDLGSAFNSLNHLFYRLDPRKPRNLLEDQVTFELAFNFNYEEYFTERDRYYHQEIEENNLHKHSNKYYNDEQIKWSFDNRIILLIIYETRYILLYVNKMNSLILSDVDNKGNELNLKIENNQNTTFFDEYRHYIRYNRKEQTLWLDDKMFKVTFYKDVIKHFYLPSQLAYGIYVAGKPKRDKRFNNYIGFIGSICNVKVALNGQNFEPFNNAFNAVNMSFIQIKNTIRQAKCAGFKNKLDPKENSLPFRKEELLNFKWKSNEPEFLAFEHSSFGHYKDTDFIILCLVGFIFLLICFLVPFSIYIILLTIKIREKKLYHDTSRFRTVAQKVRKKKKSKSLDSVYDSVYQGEIRLLK